jgi:hypothetical protein
MRVVVRSAPLLLILGGALVGCQNKNADDQDSGAVDPKLPRVTIKVPGMF